MRIQVYKLLRPDWRSPQHARLWLSSQERYALPGISGMPVSEVSSADAGNPYSPPSDAAFRESPTPQR